MPKHETLDASIRKERDRLQKARDRLMQKKKTVDQELDSIEGELAAIKAYENAKGGKPTRALKRAVRPRRGRRGEKRQAVLDLFKQHPEGLSRGELLNLMGVKGNKSGEQSVSNALSALTKQSQLGRREGKYVPAT
jgi:hypothetical protein